MDNCILVIVFLLIATSYIYKFKLDKNVQQLLYVFVGLVLIITLKTIYDKNQPAEHFFNINQASLVGVPPDSTEPPQETSLNNIKNIEEKGGTLHQIFSYLKGVPQSQVIGEENTQTLDDIKKMLAGVDTSTFEKQLSQIVIMLQNLKDSHSIGSESTTVKGDVKDSVLENRSIRESQFLQDVELRKLERELDELQKLYSEHLKEESQKTYKKIPVYSSCVMEANGTTTACGKPDGYDVETEKEVKQKLDRIGQITEPDMDEQPSGSNDAIRELVRTINEGGIKISLQGK